MTITYNSQVWLKERTLVSIDNWQATSDYIRVTALSIEAMYAIPAFHPLVIDLTDLVRMSQGAVQIDELSGGDVVASTIITEFTIAGYINPANALIPALDGFSKWEAYIVPPSRMLLPSFETPLQMIAELFLSSESDIQSWRAYGAATLYETHVMINGDFELNGSDDGRYAYKPIRLDECENVAVVEWQSTYGLMLRTHAFEVVGQASEVTEEVELLKIGNVYDVRKGHTERVTVRIDQLSRYDVWYYGDAALSSSVRITFDGVKWFNGYVTNKTVELPTSDEGELVTLELTINYARYDAI